MLRIRCINFGLDRVEKIDELNKNLQQVAHVYNHTPRDCLPLAPQWLNVPPGSHLTPYQFHCLINRITPEIVIPFGPCELEG